MENIIIESARVSFMEGILIAIGILWLLGFLRKTVYVPVVIKETKAEEEKEVIVKNDQHTIYKEKKNKDESYTDFEELKS
jgi:uncharacterized ion transporter superfamily protein YfcC